jgi:CRISPR/Cas system-associated protein Cas10 (large subunit of type III CRISPR-Cas system)
MECTHCGEKSDIAVYLREMDDALEAFMEGVYCDRI